MNVLFFIHRYPGYGGIETVTTVLGNYLVGKGYNVSIISFLQEDEITMGKLNKKIFLYRFPDKQNLESDENVAFLSNTIAEFKPDVLINQESYSKLFSLLLKMDKIPCKVITVEHNTPDALFRMTANFVKNEKLELNPKSILKRILRPLIFGKFFYYSMQNHRSLYRNSDQYILLSKNYIPVFKKTSGLWNLDKIRVIENPVTLVAQPIKLNEKEQIVLFLGRFEFEHKRPDRLVKIWEKMYMDFPDWKLVMVGDGPCRRHIEGYVAKQKIQNIVFEGARHDVEKYFTKASILCMTSNVEGWSLVLADSMAYGCVPVLYNSFASASEIIDSGSNGILIKPFDEDAYIKALSQLMKKKDERECMALKAMEVSNRFELNKVGDKWQKILEL